MRTLLTCLLAVAMIAGWAVYGDDAPSQTPDSVTAEAASLKKAVAKAKSPDQKRSLALAALKLATDAATIEEYETARSMASLAMSQFRQIKDPGVQRASSQTAYFAAMIKQHREFKTAQAKLESSPDDPKQNEIVGRYLCFAREEWDKGLVFLSKADDLDLKAIAAADLGARDSSAAQINVANEWLDVAKNYRKERTALARRAVYWLEQAVLQVPDDQKPKLKEQLKLAYELASGREFSKILSEPANGIASSGTVDCADKATTAAMSPGFNIGASWILSLQFNGKFDPGTHWILGWGDGRSAKDPIVVGLDGHTLRVQFDDCVSDARQMMTFELDPSSPNQWVDLKIVHDAIAGDFEMYVDGRQVKKEGVSITPRVDAKMPICIGALDTTGARYFGQVKGVWLGNIK